jgi:hypothetical protein
MANNWMQILATPKLTRKRVWFAFGVAAGTDAVQLALGPVGWFVVDEVLDVVAMVLISCSIGFHPLLLPTFVLELLPLADMLPTWTGCTAAVVMLRRRTAAPESAAPPPIDVAAEVTPMPPIQHRSTPEKPPGNS